MFCSRSLGRGGVTLVEMMIALIITLMIVFAMVQAFSRIGETTADGRATIEMLGQIRHCRVLMEEDISRCTIPVEMRDPRALSPDQYHGYIELVEGPASDNNLPPNVSGYYVRTGVGLTYNTFNFDDVANLLAAESRTLFGDLDDILCMTIRNDDNPFRGRFAVGPGVDGVWGNNDDVINVIESNLAEVIWWAELNDQSQPPNGAWDPGETFTIHRRVLLIRPDLAIPTPGATIQAFHRNNDVSVHYHFDATTHAPMGLQANSLGDLTFRWNRTAHDPIDFSQQDTASNPLGLTTQLTLSPIDPTQLPAYTSASMRGEDVVLSNVLGFDFRVWDPNVPTCAYAPAAGELSEGLVPGDPGYPAAFTAAAGNYEGVGAFVDLGAVDPAVSAVNAAMYPAMSNSHFVGPMQGRSYLPFGNYVYDPWTLRYETDTYNQDGVSEGMAPVVDDGDETSPPYPFPLKLLQVRIRMYESDTRQVKQVSQNIQFAK